MFQAKQRTADRMKQANEVAAKIKNIEAAIATKPTPPAKTYPKRYFNFL